MQSSGALVGRADQLRVLSDFARRVHRGHAGVCCVEGTTGYGKSALLDAFAERQEGPTRIVRTHCSSRTDAYTPLATLALDLRDRARVQGIARGLLPEVVSSVPYAGGPMRAILNSRDDWKKPLVDVSGAAKAIDTLFSFFTRAARSNPLILAIDDAHFIDPSSCSAIERLATHGTHAHLGVLLTYQPELSNPALEELLYELEQRGLVDRIRLEALN